VAAEYAMLVAAIVVLVAMATGTLEDTLSVVLRDAADCVEAGCL
jgi:Flp pilus assembly pilin Flp